MEGAVTTRPDHAARPRALDAATMCEAFQITAAERADQVALRTIADGVSITFAEYAERVRRLAAGLHALGVGPGDTVGFMLTNRPEFHLIDTAAMHLGATPFSLYNTSSPEQIAFLLGDAGNRVFVVEAAFLERAREGMSQAGVVEHLVVIDGAADGALTMAELESAEPAADFDFDAAWRSVRPEDVLTLIYTSGTTGPPKGVQLTHGNEIAQCRGIDAVGHPRPGGSIVSFLPHAHIADRGLSHYANMAWGHTVTCCPEVTQVFAHVADCHPTFWGGVPRIWEKLKAALEAGIEAEPDEAKRAATKHAIEVGLRKVRLEQQAQPVPDELGEAYERAEELVFSKIRERLGLERCEWYMIGAAPCPLEVLEFFAAIGIPICEVWGMSEITSIGTLVPADNLRLGTVGPPIPNVELRLADDGELLVRGPTVMAGYRNQPEKTAETIDRDGWLHTGDIAQIDDAGFVKIVDRKKELIINAAGKNMSPANIEQQLKQGSSLIGQAVAIGDGRPYNVALLVLDPDASAAFAQQHGLADPSPEAMSAEPAVLEEVTAGVERANAHLSRVEQIKRFRLLPCDWPPAGDELTPTMKLKRKPIADKYAAEIDALYSSA
ncbi:MAG TPA: long-chain fatty acid--CoA ligase [Solirubrobacteraceae bacterium]|nr:long-chain fatty acid--CoA ligase [Solirubrobacteraceae bacterium]